MSYVRLAGDVIEVDPLAVLSLDNTLCAQDHTEFIALGELLKNGRDTVNSELLCSLAAEAGEDLISVMMVMIVVVASARAVFIVLMMIVVMMLMIVMMLVIVAMALAVVMMLVMMTVLRLKLFYGRLKSILLLHSGKNILAVQLVPRSCHDDC